MSQVIGRHAMFRRVALALERTNTRVVCGWHHWLGGVPARQASPDEHFAETHDIAIVAPYDWRAGRTSRERLELPPWDRRKWNRVTWAAIDSIRYAGRAVPPDEVVAVTTSMGRTYYLQSFLHRVIERALALALGPVWDRRLSHAAHAYRRGRGRWTALYVARRAARRGFRFVGIADIRSYFDSILIHLVELALRTMYPEMAKELREVVLWTMTAEVRRPPRAGLPGSEPALNRVVQGSILGPLLANLVGTFVLDGMIEQRFGDRLVYVRYSDDLFFAARSAADVQDALDAVAERLVKVNMSLKAGTVGPVDVVSNPVTYLGKTLHGGQVQTLDDDLERLAAAIAATDVMTAGFGRAVNWSLDELTLDRADRARKLRQHVRELSPLHADAMLPLQRAWRARQAACHKTLDVWHPDADLHDHYREVAS